MINILLKIDDFQLLTFIYYYFSAFRIQITGKLNILQPLQVHKYSTSIMLNFSFTEVSY